MSPSSSAALIWSALLALIAPKYCDAQELIRDRNVPIAMHQQLPGGKTIEPQLLDQGWAILFQGDPALAINQITHYEELPRCNNSQIRRIPVAHYSLLSETFDVLYYAGDDRQQAKHAAKFNGRAIIYTPRLEPPSHSGLDWQTFARFIQIRCLPVRFRFTSIDGQRYIEYREGAEAWKE